MADQTEMINALTRGIESEIQSYVFYTEALKKLENENFKEIIEKLALEEKKHFFILEGQHDALMRSEKWNTTADVLRQPGLPKINEEMASKHKGLLDNVKAASTEREILDMALKLEEDARDLFLKMSKGAGSEEAKKTFDHLADFEQGHVHLVNNMIKQVEENK